MIAKLCPQNIFSYYIFMLAVWCFQISAQENSWEEKPDSLLKELIYPTTFDKISVLKFGRENVTNWYGNGYYNEQGGIWGHHISLTQKNK